MMHLDILRASLLFYFFNQIILSIRKIDIVAENMSHLELSEYSICSSKLQKLLNLSFWYGSIKM
jgi:hypothetical protein